MIQTLAKNWWLLALAGLLDAVYSLMQFLMRNPGGASFTLRAFAPRPTVVDMSLFALAAGLSVAAAGLWTSGTRRSWLVTFNGLALGVFAVLSLLLYRGRHSFLPFALLLALMAASFGILALALARSLRLRLAGEWFLALAGAASLAFAATFLVLGFRWIRLENPETYFIFMGSYFAFCALSMLALALRLNRLRSAIHGLAA